MLSDKTTAAYVSKFISSLSALNSSADEPLDQEEQDTLLSQMATKNDAAEAEPGRKKRATSNRFKKTCSFFFFFEDLFLLMFSVWPY